MPGPVHRSLADRVWRTGGAWAVDVLAWSLGWAWVREENPALADARERAIADLERMRREPVALARPVIVLNGYHAWSGVVESIRLRVAAVTSGNPHDFLAISFMDCTSFQSHRARVVREAGSWAGGGDVDVIAHSMGGLIARYCARTDHEDGHALRANRIITLATPHRGAILAKYLAPDSAARDMRAGSPFLRSLDAAPTASARLLPFAHLRDPVVGAKNAAPPSELPYWCSGSRVLSHFAIAHNPVVVAAIARELRGEPPLFEWRVSAPPRN